MQMHDEIAHMRIVDALLRIGFPGRVSGRVIGNQADKIDLVVVLEGVVLYLNEFADED
jgi:hypothetical protein